MDYEKKIEAINKEIMVIAEKLNELNQNPLELTEHDRAFLDQHGLETIEEYYNSLLDDLYQRRAALADLAYEALSDEKKRLIEEEEKRAEALDAQETMDEYNERDL
jgi:hypothetical protein